MSLADDRELVELAAGVVLRDDASAPPAERALALDVNRARSRIREHENNLALLAELKAKQDAIAHEQLTDPLTRIPARLLPIAPDDVVIIGCGEKSNFFEFRRDGQRVQYTTRGPIACIPKADWERENWGSDWVDTQRVAIAGRATLVCSAEHFKDLPKMLADAYVQQRFPADIRANSLDAFLTTAIDTTDHERIPQLVAWWTHATAQEGPPYGEIAASIRSRLARLGELGQIIDEAAEIVGCSTGLPPFKKEVSPFGGRGGDTAMTREWAQRGERG